MRGDGAGGGGRAFCFVCRPSEETAQRPNPKQKTRHETETETKRRARRNVGSRCTSTRGGELNPGEKIPPGLLAQSESESVPTAHGRFVGSGPCKKHSKHTRARTLEGGGWTLFRQTASSLRSEPDKTQKSTRPFSTVWTRTRNYRVLHAAEVGTKLRDEG